MMFDYFSPNYGEFFFYLFFVCFIFLKIVYIVRHVQNKVLSKNIFLLRNSAAQQPSLL
jgi:hypothetical protein